MRTQFAARVTILSTAFVAALLVNADAAAQTCPAANPNDFVSDDSALQTCLNGGGTVTLVAGSPGYIIETGLVLQTNNQVLQGSGPTKPLLIAHPNLRAPMLRVPQFAPPGVTGYTIRDLAFNGNKQMRVYHGDCGGDYNSRTHGYNLQVKGTGWTVERVDSDNALCGSALEAECINCVVRNNNIRDNGFPYPSVPSPGAVSDGITMANCIGGLVQSNQVSNNTDVNLIVGQGSGCLVSQNQITQTVVGQVGLMIGFGGDHSGSVVEYNTIQSGLNMLIIGLMLGDHPWDPNVTLTHAGTVQFNDMQGAMVLAAVDGIAAGNLVNNTGGNRQGGPVPLPNCPPSPAYTAGDFGSAVLQPGWVPQTYHNLACQ